MKKKLLGLTIDELKDVTKEVGLPAFAAKQIANWLYVKRVKAIEDMTNLSKKGRETLASLYEVGYTLPSQTATSEDGTIKYLFEFENGLIETVFIPEKDRATLCVSCQVGCKMDCLFCMTGKQGFTRNLTVNEIINQVYAIPEFDKLTNIVYMGMGEPFDNTLAVLKSLRVLTEPWGRAFSPRRITVSTVGVVPGLKQFLDRSESHLAISLHNAFAEERLEIIPTEKAYPIEQTIPILKKYDFSHQRRVSFEYILFERKNDSLRHAMQVVKLLNGLHCRVNLIYFHPIPNIPLKSPDEKTFVTFRDYLTNHGVMATIRRSRGVDILAACGLLSSTNKKEA